MAATNSDEHLPQLRNDASGRPTRDVQDKLRESFRSRREKENIDLPYPVKFAQSQLAYESWNQMFLQTLTQEPGKSSITLHSFESPPKRVLDLGCGNGLWVLEAATKHWQHSTFVGFDIERKQPDVKLVDNKCNIVGRIGWVHGNFLKGLPQFSNGEFDYVRMCGLGLAVPEDEWQGLLQEVRRILKPRGVVEIYEEDLIFPAATAPNYPKDPFSGSSLLTANTPYRHSVTSPSTSFLMDNAFALNFAFEDDLSKMSTDSSATEIQTIGRASTLASGLSGYNSSRVQEHRLDPRDHSKLKTAWQNMLHRRFLAPRITAVLPFYINSEFEDMQTHPAMHIPLPPNSKTGSFASQSHSPSSRGSGSESELRIDFRSISISRDSVGEQDDVSLNSQRSTIANQRAVVHLGRAVSIIDGCKEAIWEEFDKLFGERGRMELGPGLGPSKANRVRQEFEQAWTNWHNDMRDRMCMSGNMNKWLSWSLTADSERPDWKVWRDRGDSVDSDTLSVASGLNPVDVDLCRSLRGFVAWKTASDDASAGL